MAMTDLEQLGLDVYRGAKVTYNEVKGDDAIRNILVDSIGGKWSYHAWSDHKGAFFSVVEELLRFPMVDTLEGLFDGILDTETIALGDVKRVNIDKPELFRVATIASGNSDIRRQTIRQGRVMVETEKLGIKIYEEFDRFIAGSIDWAELISRVRKSLSAEIANRVYSCLAESFDSSLTLVNKTGAVNEAELDKMIAAVEGLTGMKCAIYGGKAPLGTITKATTLVNVNAMSDKQKNDYADFGYTREYKGTPMIELPTIVDGQGNVRFADEFYVLPIGSKIIKLVLEGSPFIRETNASETNRNDQQIEFLIEQKMGVVCLVAGYFGIWKNI